MRVLLSGASGVIGRALADMVERDSACSLAAEASRDAFFPSNVAGDVLIDFSHPALTERSIALAEQLSIPAVIGTTGLTERCQQRIAEAARRIPVCVAANFSIGVNLMLALAARAARDLPASFDIEIAEIHHRRKLDAPSGTALALGEALALARKGSWPDSAVMDRSVRREPRPAGEIGVQAARGGDVAGEHTVYFLGDGERLEISHRATDCSIFARGALLAAKKLVGRPPGQVDFQSLVLASESS